MSTRPRVAGLALAATLALGLAGCGAAGHAGAAGAVGGTAASAGGTRAAASGTGGAGGAGTTDPSGASSSPAATDVAALQQAVNQAGTLADQVDQDMSADAGS